LDLLSASRKRYQKRRYWRETGQHPRCELLPAALDLAVELFFVTKKCGKVRF
jgi:hypothetical protein